MKTTSYSTFSSMNTNVYVEVVHEVSLLSQVHECFSCIKDFFNKVGTTLSRFLPTSELTAINTATETLLSKLAFDYISESLFMAEKTFGLYDPCVRVDLLGYDESWEVVKQRLSKKQKHEKRYSWRDVELCYLERIIKKPKDLHLDLGGMAKGYTVDKTAQMLRNNGYVDFYLDAGGDAYASGYDEKNEPWEVTIQNPFKSDEVLEHKLFLSNRAIATSSGQKRAWIDQHGEKKHHIINPLTSDSAKEEFGSLSCIANRCVEADVYAKVFFILGEKQSLQWKQNNDIAFVGVTMLNSIVFSPTVMNFTRKSV